MQMHAATTSRQHACGNNERQSDRNMCSWTDEAIVEHLPECSQKTGKRLRVQRRQHWQVQHPRSQKAVSSKRGHGLKSSAGRRGSQGGVLGRLRARQNERTATFHTRGSSHEDHATNLIHEDREYMSCNGAVIVAQVPVSRCRASRRPKRNANRSTQR